MKLYASKTWHTASFNLYNMIKRAFLILLILCYPFTILLSQVSEPLYRVFVELKAGLHRERNLLTDPAGQLNKAPHTGPTTGINAGIFLNDGRSVLGIDYDVVTIGNSFIFRSVLSSYGEGRSFSRLTPNYQYQLPLLLKKNNFPKLSLVGKIGPSVTFTSSPKGSTGTVSTVFLDNNNDTTAFIFTQDKLNRTFAIGLTLGAGILYTPNPRLRFSYSIYPSWNLTSNDVIIQDIQYRFFNDPAIYNARALSTGTTFTQSISMGYAFGKTQLRKDQIARKKRLYTPEEWDKRKRWSLIFITSNTYPTIDMNDPAGYLTKTPVERFTYGAQFFYRFKPKWNLGMGFESVPYQLDGRTPPQVGGNGTFVRNSLQFPLLAEYELLRTDGKIKMEWLARGGVALGLQRKAIADPQMDFDERTISQPEFYYERETKDRPSGAFLAAVAGTRINIALSKNIFLTGYAQYQMAVTKNTFHRSRVHYQVGSPQAPLYKAELSTRGSTFLPGFGIGFKL